MFAALALVAAPAAQDVLRVEGTVRDEAGAPLAGVAVRIESCSHWPRPGLLAVELAREPLPSARSNAAGAWSLVLGSALQRWENDVQGGLALVATADGFQPWRETLPSPAGLFGGSDVVLRRRAPGDRATVRVVDAPPGAIVRVRRLGDRDYLANGGRPAGELTDLPVPPDGELVVDVPLLPTPLVCAATDAEVVLAWGVQLFAPGRCSAELPIAAGQTVELRAAPAPTPVVAKDAAGEVVALRDVLMALPDRSVRWFPAHAGGVAIDAHAPVVAVRWRAAHGGDVTAAWPGPLPVAPAAVAARLRIVDAAGAPRRDAMVFWCTPESLRHHDGVGLRPHLVVRPERAVDGVIAIDPATTATCAWLSAPGCVPEFVLDVRTLPANDGTATVALTTAPRTLAVKVIDAAGAPVADAIVCGGATCSRGSDLLRDLPWLTAAGELPHTDAAGECTLPATGDWPLVDVQAAGHGDATIELDQALTVCTATVRPRTYYRARTVGADGTPRPFRGIGTTRLLAGDAAGASYSIDAVVSDSRGNLVTHALTTAATPPEVAPGRLGSYPERGTKLVPGAVADVVVGDEPWVIVQLPRHDAHAARYARVWDRALPGVPLAGEGMNALRAPHAIAFRWPSELRLWLREVAGGPPIALALGTAAGPLVHVDATRFARTTPLRLQGADPVDLALLRAVPKSVADAQVAGFQVFAGEYLAPDRGTLQLRTRDELAHRVTLLHPQLVPVDVKIAAGDAGRQEVVADVVAGAPCTVHVRLAAPLHANGRLALTARSKQRVLATVALDDARFATAAVKDGIDVATPFALPPGAIDLELHGPSQQRARVVVDGTAPVRAEFAPR